MTRAILGLGGVIIEKTMSKSLIILLLGLMSLSSCGQRTNSQRVKAVADSEVVDSLTLDKRIAIENPDLAKYIFTDTTYNGIRIQNSYPKGGMIEPGGIQYIDQQGRDYGFVVCWTRIINETASPIDLSVNFPADSFTVFAPPSSCLKLLLPTATMTLDKLNEFNYGFTGVKSFLEANFYKETKLQKTIEPNEEHIFYIASLSYDASGTVRAAMILKEEELSYIISIAPHGIGTIPCGKLTFKNDAEK